VKHKNMKKLIPILIVVFLGTASLTYAGFFDWIGGYFSDAPIIGAPTTIYQRTLLPETDSTYELGTSTKAWLRINTDELCLTADSCKTTWPTGGGTTINQLGQIGDVSTSTLAYGHLAMWDGANWQDTATSSLGLGGSSGTVSSVAMTVPTGFSISGSPITSAGTLALTYGAGYEGLLTASTTKWGDFYYTPSTRITAGTAIDWSSNTLNVDVTGDWTGTFDGQQGSYYLDFANLTNTGTSTLPQLSITESQISDLDHYTDADVSTYLTSGTGIDETAGALTFDCSDVEGTGIDCTGEAITLNATGDWTGTFDGYNGPAIAMGTTSVASITTLANLSTVGTITTGTWGGTTIAVNKGGTGLTSGYNNTNWDTAYGWGNHTGLYDILGQATSTLASHTTTYNHANYDTAYGWGDHSVAGYLLGSNYYATTTHPLISSLPALTTVGTIGTGVWQGTAIADSYISSAATWNAKQAGDADLTAIAALTNTKGNLIVGGPSSAWVALGIGADAKVLTASSTAPNGVSWETVAGGGGGTVTSVDMSVPTGLTISGNPITTSGTLALTLTNGYNIPLTASTTDWNSLWQTPSTRITAGTNLSWSGNTLNATGGGGVGTVSTSTSPTIGNLAYWTSKDGWPEKLGTVATTTLTGTAPIVFSQPISVLGGSASVITCTAASGSVAGCLSSANWTTFNNKADLSSAMTGTFDGNNFAGGAIGTGDVLYGSGAGAISELGIGSTGNVLTVSGGLPTWAATSTLGFLSASSIDTYAELNAIVADFTITHNGLIDTSAELRAIMTDEVGTGKLAFSQYPAFAYATSTAWTGTTTIPLGVAFNAETWDAVKCFTDTGTVNVDFYDGTNRMGAFNASTTVGTITLSTNNTFTASEKRYVDLGTPASSPTKVSCTVSKRF